MGQLKNCPACLRKKQKVRARHKYPTRIFGMTFEGNVEFVYLCEDCYWELSNEWYPKEKSEKWIYHELWALFMTLKQNKRINVPNNNIDVWLKKAFTDLSNYTGD